MITKSNEELWKIAQEINKKERTKDEILKEHKIRVRTWSDLLRNTPIRYKNNKEGYVWEENKVNENTDVRTSEEEPNHVSKNDIKVSQDKKAGRPRIYTEGHTELKKLTLEINKTVYNALQFKKITEGITINKYIENLLIQNIEEVYFSTVKKLNK